MHNSLSKFEDMAKTTFQFEETRILFVTDILAHWNRLVTSISRQQSTV